VDLGLCEEDNDCHQAQYFIGIIFLKEKRGVTQQLKAWHFVCSYERAHTTHNNLNQYMKEVVSVEQDKEKGFKKD